MKCYSEPKREEVGGYWRKLHNEEHHEQFKEDGRGRACGTRGVEEKSIRGFGGDVSRKRPLGRPRYRGEDNIKMDLKEI